MKELEIVTVARTLLFVPGDHPGRFTRAASSDADEIVIDLEDAVAPEAKATARNNAREWRSAGGHGVIRINGPGSDWYEDDICALSDRPSAVMVPKVTTAAQVEDLMTRLPAGSRVIPIFETAASVLDARAICAVCGVARAAFGNGDLATELGIDYANQAGLAYSRSAIVLASAASRIPPPLDGVTTAIDDEQTLTADTVHAAMLGFTGKLCIHPRQVSVIHRALTPSADELRWAHSVLGVAKGASPMLIEGQMIDRPIVNRARMLINRSADSHKVEE